MNLSQVKQQREICWLTRRLKEAGIDKRDYQTNPGVRPVETAAMPDNVDWSTQNANPMPIRPLRDRRGGGRGRGSNYGRPAGTSEVSTQRATVHDHGKEQPNEDDVQM